MDLLWQWQRPVFAEQQGDSHREWGTIGWAVPVLELHLHIMTFNEQAISKLCVLKQALNQYS